MKSILIIILLLGFMLKVNAKDKLITTHPTNLPDLKELILKHRGLNSPKTYEGNKIGENTIEIQILIVKITIKRIACDKMPNRICYENQGESTNGSHITVMTDTSISSGTVYEPEVVNDYGNYTETVFKFYSDGYNESGN